MVDIDAETSRYRTLFEAIYRFGSTSELETSWDEYVDKIMHLEVERWFDTLACGHLNQNGPMVVLDWKEVMSVPERVNQVAAASGIDERFEWSTPEPVADDMARALHAADQWLRAQGRALLNLDTLADFYLLAVVSTSDAALVPEVMGEIAAQADIDKPLVMAIPDNWATDVLPERPATTNEPLRRTVPGNSKAISATKVAVRENPPDSWFIVFEDPPHPDSYGSMRFEGPFIGAGEGRNNYVQCRDVNDAVAFAKYADANRVAKHGRRVVRLDEARSLFDAEVYYRRAQGLDR